MLYLKISQVPLLYGKAKWTTLNESFHHFITIQKPCDWEVCVFLPFPLPLPYSKVNIVLKINYQAQKTVVLYTHLIFPDLTKSKNLISRTPVSPAELLSSIIILGFFKDTDFSFCIHFFFWGRKMIMSLKHYSLCLGKKGITYDESTPLLHLPRGGPCVMSMSMPSGIRFHLSSRDWPLGRLKPQPLNHGVLWGR